MPTYIGFSTINAYKPQSTNMTVGIGGGTGSTTQTIVPGKKFRLVDNDLIVQDFINALNIPQGQMPGKPEYGTTIWSYVFEPNSIESQRSIEDEIRRIASNEPRLIINTIQVYPEENGIMIQIELATLPTNQVQTLNVILDRATSKAGLIGNDY
jgi:phage baseplate assembly protein W